MKDGDGGFWLGFWIFIIFIYGEPDLLDALIAFLMTH